jgi:hypothetical protein
MDDLLARAIAAHGGFDRSNKFNQVTAAVVRAAGCWQMKGLEPDLNPPLVTVKNSEQMRTKENVWVSLKEKLHSLQVAIAALALRRRSSS